MFLSEDHTFVVKYKVKKIGDENECVTEEIRPYHLGTNDIYSLMYDYNISFHPVTKEITKVTNR